MSLAAAPARSASARAPVAKARAVPWSVVAGLLFWLAAVAAGYRAQHFLTPENQVVAGALWYGAAVVLAVTGVGLIDRRAAPREQRAAEPTLAPRVWRAPRQAGGLALTLVGVAVGAGMTYLLWIQPRGGFVAPKALFFDPSTVYGKAFWLWVVAMAAVLGGAALMARNPPRLSWARPSRAGLIELAGVLGLLAITLAYRLIGLPQIPYEVHGDEAAIGVAARAIMHGDAPSLFWVGWADVPNMSYAIPAAFMSLVGDNLFGLRIASVVQGTLSVLLTYLIARRLFGWRIGLVAGVLLAMNHWHVHFSRTGFHYMQAVFAGTLFVYLMLRAIDTRRAANWLLAGFAVGLGFEVYYGARIAPVIGAVYLVHQAVRDRAFFTKHWSGVLAMCGGALLFAAPVIVFFVQHPDTFLNRTNGVSVTNPDIQNHLIRSFGVNTLGEAMLIQLRNSVLAFNQRGETSLQYGHHGPLVDYWTSVFFVVGLAVITFRLTRPRYSMLAAWFWLTLIAGSVMTVDALFSPRVVIITPVLFIAAAIGIDAGWRGVSVVGGRIATWAFVLPLLALGALAARENYDIYFNQHIVKEQPAGFATLFATYVNGINDKYRVYWLGPADSYIRYDTIDFLSPNLDALDIRDKPLRLPVDRVPRDKGIAFLARAGTESRLNAVEQMYPGSQRVTIAQTNGYVQFYAYLVSHDAILAAKPDALVDDGRIPVLTPEELAARDKERASRGTP